MGCEGGTIPGRRDLVKTKKEKKQEADPNLVAADRWTTCAISGEALSEPVVLCELGNLYNKEALITKHLLSKNKLPAFGHITSLKDVIGCKLKWNESSDEKKSTSEVKTFVCPVTSQLANGKYRFVLMRHCGCVLSERALKEVSSTSCLGCGTQIPTDLALEEQTIVINPTTKEEIEAIKARLVLKLAVAAELRKQEKKHKKEQSKNVGSKVKDKEETKEKEKESEKEKNQESTKGSKEEPETTDSVSESIEATSSQPKSTSTSSTSTSIATSTSSTSTSSSSSSSQKMKHAVSHRSQTPLKA